MLLCEVIPTPQLDPQSQLPLYQQLHRHFTELIRSQAIKRGERLPATRELAGMLGLNRTTVSAAYELLESEGLISGQVGRGSFVTGEPGAKRTLLEWEHLLDRAAIPAMPSLGKDGISFATSRPADDLFPLQDFRLTCDEVLGGGDLTHILQLGSPAGYEPLRRHLQRERGVVRAGDDLIITSGCQQGLDLIVRVLVRPGDKVAVEDPVYPGIKNLLSQAGAS